jgi:DEAD/DEAH box helicase/Helicase C-terminal domain
MAFKKSNKTTVVPENPAELFRALPNRKFPAEMPHQKSIIESYVASALNEKDVALQLPTGSGKTLVGLLIAEWRRRKFKETVVYLCPTRQLVHQTAEQARDKYGLDVLAFAGGRRNYKPADVARYRRGDVVGITTYSSLFNTNPFFDDAQTIIIDDAHAAENYIASMWTLDISPVKDEHKALYSAMLNVLKPHVSPLDFARMSGEGNSSADAAWIDKVPTPTFFELKDELIEVLEAHVGDTDLRYVWALLRDHLDACHLYLSPRGIVVRPLVPPSWSHHAFQNASHRIYMSATLGEGGDLERLTGREKIHRIAVPDGFEAQGVGRRFFMFPGMSLDLDKCEKLRSGLVKEAGRAVVLTPSQAACDAVGSQIESELKCKIFSADDIEMSKSDFIATEKAVAILAGRYDGIDFPMDECQLLCVDGLPRAMNLQERFLMSRMGAGVLFNERIQTRVLQAVGRCTRALQDSSAVYITGTELQDYLAQNNRQKYFHPELQAELRFGIEQSIDLPEGEFIDNFKMFLEKGSDWTEANDGILSETKILSQEKFPAMDDLGAAVKAEVRYQKAMWSSDYVEAFTQAKNVLGHLKASELQGYRAMWSYLAGSAAHLAAVAGATELASAAREQFGNAKKATSTLPWLVRLASFDNAGGTKGNPPDQETALQVERLEEYLCRLGTTHDGSFAKIEKLILEGIADPKHFEAAHKSVGEILGFDAGKEETSGAPDPWWTSKFHCLVFEDHADAQSSSMLSVTKARQVASHPAWIEHNRHETSGLEILPVLVTPVSKADDGALPHLNDVSLWPLNDFRVWVSNALAVVRELRSTLTGPGDMVWRAQANETLEMKGLTMAKIVAMLRKSSASDFFKK